MKKYCAIILCMLLALCAIVPAGAAVVVGYELNIPSQAAAGKSVSAQIALFCGSGCDLGAMLFTVEYDTGVLTYREAKLSAGAPGELRAYDGNGVLKIVYLNTSGTALNEVKKELVSLRFTASAAEQDTTLTLYGEQAASAREQRISYGNPSAYDVSVQKKVSENPAPAKARKVTSSTSKSTVTSSKSRSPSGTGGQDLEDGGYIDPWEQNQEGDSTESEGGFLSIGENGSNPFENNGFWIVICAAGLAAVLFFLIFGAYRLGQKKKSVSAPGNEKEINSGNVHEDVPDGDIEVQETQEERKGKGTGSHE